VANAPAATPLTRRIETALKEGRIAQALELAKQFARQEPGPASLALQRKCYLAAAENHVHRGAFRDAHAILTDAEKLNVDDTAWWEKLAELRADLGDHPRALQLLDKATGTSARPRILGRVADRALREGPAGKEILPADLRPQFELVRQAFADYEAGRDEPAREKLNGIGLSSPFLEWKLLLRGLMAWSANDLARAVENWSRLSPDRLPSKLADPFRIQADKGYAAKLPANRVAAVSRQAESLTGGVADGLRRLRKQLANDETIPDALETARIVVPELKRVAPDLVPRLANVVYWTLVGCGQPDDLPRFNRIFGPPSDDPQFFRLQALVMEAMHRLDQAHGFWGKFEDWIAKTPARWPGEQGNRARALVLERMGRLARDWLQDEGDDEDELFGFLEFFERNQRRQPRTHKPLRPSPEECFRKAGELAPDWVKPAMELLQEYSDDAAKAHPAIAEVLARFPNDLKVLECAAEFYERIGDMAKAHECIKRALAANPLDRELREQASNLALHEARRHGAEKEYDAARAALREAADLKGGSGSPAIQALAAAIELAAKNTEAFQAHRDSLLNQPGGRLSGAYRLMVEGLRQKLKKKDMGEYQTAFTDGLAGPATAKELTSLLDAVAQYQQEPTKYRGLQSHSKKVLERVVQFASSGALPGDMLDLSFTLHDYNLSKPLQTIAEEGMRRFPNDAYFHFFAAEAMLSRRRADYINYNIGARYQRVRLLMSQGKSDYYSLLQDMLDDRLKKTPDLDRWLNNRWGLPGGDEW
jgi:tetratricopeptide (TPR) repeat protein